MIRNWRVRDWQIVASKRDRKRTFRFSKGWNTEAPFRDYVLRELPVADLHRWESAQGRRIVKRNGEKKKSTEPFVIWTNRVKSERQTDSNAETKKEDESLVGRIVATIRLLRERGSWTDRSCQLKPRWSDAFNLTKKKKRKKKKKEERKKKKERKNGERVTNSLGAISSTHWRSLKAYYRISRQSREADHRQLAPLYGPTIERSPPHRVQPSKVHRLLSHS